MKATFKKLYQIGGHLHFPISDRRPPSFFHYTNHGRFTEPFYMAIKGILRSKNEGHLRFWTLSLKATFNFASKKIGHLINYKINMRPPKIPKKILKATSYKKYNFEGDLQGQLLK